MRSFFAIALLTCLHSMSYFSGKPTFCVTTILRSLYVVVDIRVFSVITVLTCLLSMF